MLVKVAGDFRQPRLVDDLRPCRGISVIVGRCVHFRIVAGVYRFGLRCRVGHALSVSLTATVTPVRMAGMRRLEFAHTKPSFGATGTCQTFVHGQSSQLGSRCSCTCSSSN